MTVLYQGTTSVVPIGGSAGLQGVCENSICEIAVGEGGPKPASTPARKGGICFSPGRKPGVSRKIDRVPLGTAQFSHRLFRPTKNRGSDRALAPDRWEAVYQTSSIDDAKRDT